MDVRRSTAGFTLIEVVVALALLAGVVLVMATSAGKHLSSTTKNRQRRQAAAAADARIAMVRMSPIYDSLKNRFDSTHVNTPLPGMTRVTKVVRTGTGTTNDLTRVTVTVSGGGLATPIARSTVIAAP